ncbi:hypothetical protein BN1708_013255 [Verticillium longisporum]|uniref:Uncharacterized protein n=1 Tax=Verticillium longisporum TaxID=100787 RepID=A0A0G4LIX5_VERLO|nr:hypothetical protein BN1708_013255 [Verticillium longisporum]
MDRGVSMPLSSASSVDGATIGSSVDGMSYCRISFARLTCAIVPQHVLDDRRLRRPVSSPVCPADAASAGWPSTGHDGHVARVGRTARFRPPEYCLRIPQVSQDEEVGSQADRYSEGLACRWTAGATADEPCGREGEEGEEEEGEHRTHVLAEQLAVTVWTTVMVDTSVDTTVATTVRPVDGTTLDAMLTWKSDDDDDDAAGGTLACAPGVVCPSRGAPADGVDAPAGACPVLVDVWLAVGDACNPVEDVADASDPDPDNIAPVGGAPSDSGADPSVLVLVIALLEPGALLNATRKSVVVCVTSVGTVETNVVDDRTIVASVLRVTTDSDTHPIRPTFTSGRWGSPRPPAIVAIAPTATPTASLAASRITPGNAPRERTNVLGRHHRPTGLEGDDRT